jgi:predicted RNA-binding Zn ribbon-like protein
MLDTYEDRHITLVEDLINTFDSFLEQPEHLREPSDLKDFLELRGIQVGEVSDSDLEEVRGLRRYLRATWEAETLEEAIRMLNLLFANISVFVQLEANSQAKPQFQFQVQPEASVAQRLAVAAATGIVAAIERYGVERLASCAAEPCRDVFIDLSRNQSRRFCSERCANRHNTAAFRLRRRKTGADT